MIKAIVANAVMVAAVVVAEKEIKKAQKKVIAFQENPGDAKYVITAADLVKVFGSQIAVTTTAGIAGYLTVKAITKK